MPGELGGTSGRSYGGALPAPPSHQSQIMTSAGTAAIGARRTVIGGPIL
ncbi:MAG: hypothetical protein WA761_02550 [Thermoplasmata archaeon]